MSAETIRTLPPSHQAVVHLTRRSTRKMTTMIIRTVNMTMIVRTVMMTMIMMTTMIVTNVIIEVEDNIFQMKDLLEY
jgi:hypothetical protein